LVVRLAGSGFDTVKKYLATVKTSNDASIVIIENLDEAVVEAVRLAKSTHHKKF
jgi:succinyl-CoA synthetase beta subunit